MPTAKVTRNGSPAKNDPAIIACDDACDRLREKFNLQGTAVSYKYIDDGYAVRFTVNSTTLTNGQIITELTNYFKDSYTVV